MKTDEQRLADYTARVGWFGEIPEGHYAIPDPHDPTVVSMWRVKRGQMEPWPKQARFGPRLYRRDLPPEPEQARVAIEAYWVTVRGYREEVATLLATAPEQAAARYAAVTFRCAMCNRALKVPESNGYGVGPECRSWMPSSLLATYAAQVARLRAEIGGAA